MYVFCTVTVRVLIIIVNEIEKLCFSTCRGWYILPSILAERQNDEKEGSEEGCYPNLIFVRSHSSEWEMKNRRRCGRASE